MKERIKKKFKIESEKDFRRKKKSSSKEIKTPSPPRVRNEAGDHLPQLKGWVFVSNLCSLPLFLFSVFFSDFY
jgi:hypothetical protein